MDADGQKWDAHAWCELMDQAMVVRKNADERRRELGIKTCAEEDQEEYEFFKKEAEQMGDQNEPL